MTLLHALLALCVAAVATPISAVWVDYAGSLTATMEGPVAAALLRDRGLRFEGEGKGSKALANLILAGVRNPDVFISADTSLLDQLKRAHLIASYTVFGSARMVVGYSEKSPHADMLRAAASGGRSILDVLDSPGVRIGRTDPALDPKGARTVRALALLGGLERQRAKAEQVLRNAPEFPEEDLAVRVESGELDAGFFYSTETAPKGLKTIELPAPANLSNEITYSIATLTNAPHPQDARTFVEFLLHGEGRAILERAGVRFF